MNTELLMPSDPLPSTPPKGHVDPATYATAKAACAAFYEEHPDLDRRGMLLSLIILAIEAGANTIPSIIGAVRPLRTHNPGKPYTTSEIAVAVKTGAGPNSAGHSWYAGPNDTYILHD
jgi:hypothetical protein